MGRLASALERVAVGVVVKRAAAVLALSGAGLLSLQSEEGVVPVVYKDTVRINTVCMGHVTTAPVGTRFTADQCEVLAKQDTSKASAAVQRLVKVPLSQDQFDALVSLVFNIGTGAFEKSTLLRDLNAGKCYQAGADFLMWSKQKELLPRRKRESAKFEKDC